MKRASIESVLDYVQSMAQLKNEQYKDAQNQGDSAAANAFKLESDTYWAVHRNILVGDLGPFTEKVKSRIESFKSLNR